VGHQAAARWIRNHAAIRRRLLSSPRPTNLINPARLGHVGTEEATSPRRLVSAGSFGVTLKLRIWGRPWRRRTGWQERATRRGARKERAPPDGGAKQDRVHLRHFQGRRALDRAAPIEAAASPRLQLLARNLSRRPPYRASATVGSADFPREAPRIDNHQQI
jgi:hypothetical protein